MNDLIEATTSAEDVRAREADDAEVAQLRAMADARVAEMDAAGTSPAPDDDILKEMEARSNAEFAHQDQLAVKEATPSPSPEEIKARGDVPATVLVREAWNATAGFGKYALDAPGYVFAGVFDAVKELGNTLVSVDDQLKDLGGPVPMPNGSGGTYIPKRPEGAVTVPGAVGKGIQAVTTAMDPWMSDTFEQDSVLRKLTQAVTGFVTTKRIAAASGLTKGLVSVGRATAGAITKDGTRVAAAMGWTGKTAMEAMHAGVAQAWSMAEDETIIDGLVALGIPRTDTLAYLDSSEDSTEFENRIKNGVTTAMGAAAIQPAIDFALAPTLVATLKSMKKVRTYLRGAADKADEMGDPTLTETIRATQERNGIVHEQLVGILGDSSQPMYVKEGARGAGVADPLAPVRSVAAKLTPDEAMDSVLTRAESDLPNAARQGAAPEPLYNRINFARIDSPDDIKRAASDFQEGFEGEINTAVGPKRTLAAVEADAKELDGWALVKEKTATGAASTDAENLEMRNFYILSLRKFMDVAKLHRDNPTDATRAAGAKMMEIVRETQRIVRRDSAQASRTLGALRIPARQAEGYTLHKQLGELMPELEAGDVDTVLKAVANASAKNDPAAAVNIALNLDGIKSAGRAVNKQIKNLYYFSLLSRLTTHIRNGVGSPAFFMLRMGEMQVANQLGHLLGEQGVYDGEVTANVAGFMKGMGEAFRLPELVGSFDEGMAAVASKDTHAIGAAIDKFANAFDGGAYKAFAQNKSSFGGSQIADAAQVGPLFGSKPTHLLGYSTEENVGRALNLIHSVTVRPLKAVVSTPGRALNAMDEVFKTANQRAEIRGLAYRQAYNEVKMGTIPADQMSVRVEQIAANPNTGLLIAGERAAQAGTFTARPTGPYGRWMEAGHNLPILGPLIIPFSRAPSNISWEGIRRTPLGALPWVDSFLADVTSGNPRVRDLAWSRMLVGNMAILGTLDFFMDGDRVRIMGDVKPEGGPAESQQRRRSFMDPLTIQISTNPDGGFEEGSFVSVPIRGYDPVTFPVVIAANLLQHMEQGVLNEKEYSQMDQVGAYSSAVAGVLTSQTSLSSMRDFFTAMGEGRLGDFLLKQAATVPTPGLTEQFVPLSDDVYRETFSMMDQIRAGTPGLSDSLPAARDAWGFEKHRMPGWSGVFQPMMPRVVDTDRDIQPVDNWIMKRGFYIGEPSKDAATFRDGVKVPWFRYPQAFEEYKRLAGQGMIAPERQRDILTQVAVGNIVGPPSGWQSATDGGLIGELNLLVKGKHPRMQKTFDMLPDDDARLNYIHQAISFYRGAAREKLLQDSRFADLATEVTMKKNAQAEQQKDPMKRQRLQFGFGANLRGGSE